MQIIIKPDEAKVVILALKQYAEQSERFAERFQHAQPLAELYQQDAVSARQTAQRILAEIG